MKSPLKEIPLWLADLAHSYRIIQRDYQQYRKVLETVLTKKSAQRWENLTHLAHYQNLLDKRLHNYWKIMVARKRDALNSSLSPNFPLEAAMTREQAKELKTLRNCLLKAMAEISDELASRQPRPPAKSPFMRPESPLQLDLHV